MTTPPLFGVIVPVKPPVLAKSRLHQVGDAVRRSLALAFAADTVAAALGAAQVGLVLAVTDDVQVADLVGSLGADVINDPSTVGLNATAVLSAAGLALRHPDLRPLVLCADLPCLRTAELDRALAGVPAVGMAFMSDADRIGTTLVTAPDHAGLRPRFGPDSRSRHLDQGSVELDGEGVPGLRRDVDTPADLVRALELGVGPHTARVTAGLV